MNEATLNGFRMIADAMLGGEAADWCWVGKWMSQRMFGITEKRAKDYAARHGGEAMTCAAYNTKMEVELAATKARVARLEREYQENKG